MRGTFASHRRELQKQLRADLSKAQDAEQAVWFQTRLAFLKSLELGGRPPVAPVKPARPVEAPPEKLDAREQEFANAVAKRLRRTAVAA